MLPTGMNANPEEVIMNVLVFGARDTRRGMVCRAMSIGAVMFVVISF